MASSSSSSYTKYEILRRDPNPSSAALLVIDMQNYFSSIATPILPNVLTTVDLCRAAGIPVIYTRHCHRSPSDGAMLAERWNGHLIFDGTPESEFLPSIGRVPDRDLVVEKSTYSAFAGGTNLEEILRKMGVEEVIVTGVMTNVCCETTTRDAFDRGFRVFFSVDATGTAHKELHDATIKNLAYAFAYLVDCKRLKEGFSGSKV